MKAKFIKRYFIAILIIVCGFSGTAQIKKERIKVGFTYGTGSQSRYPFNLKDYTHEIRFYKGHINYLLKQKRKWAFEINIEPSYNIVEHQLLNKYFIKPTEEDVIAKRELFTQKRTIKEYVLNFGILARYPIFKNLSTYAIGSLGGMIADEPTERLAEGFAFSDVFGIGLSYKIDKITIDCRYSVRHTSNLEMKKPNNGHNTTNFECGLLFQL